MEGGARRLNRGPGAGGGSASPGRLVETASHRRSNRRGDRQWPSEQVRPDRRRGQALIEFAMVVLPFFLSIYSSVAIMLHSWQLQVASNAAVRAAQYAASGDPNHLDRDQARAAGDIARQTMGNIMFASQVQVLPLDAGCGGMPPDGTVWICISHLPGDLVQAEVKGRPTSLLPSFWNSTLLVDRAAVGHLQTFQR
jgi:hypothetical protein